MDGQTDRASYTDARMHLKRATMGNSTRDLPEKVVLKVE